MPFLVRASNGAGGAGPQAVGDVGTLELVPRNCRLEEYRKLTDVPTFAVTGKLIAYASPDSTYAVTRRLLDAAREEVLIGIYDFTADYVKDLLLNVMQRGVKVSVMLDIDSEDEQELLDELSRFGATTVAAPSCASKHVSYFPSSHEKVIVVDNAWTLVQSGNYSRNSIPFNEQDGGDPDRFVTGNRDMGVAIFSKPLAAFFTQVLKSDMKLETRAEKGEGDTEAAAGGSGRTGPPRPSGPWGGGGPSATSPTSGRRSRCSASGRWRPWRRCWATGSNRCPSTSRGTGFT